MIGVLFAFGSSFVDAIGKIMNRSILVDEDPISFGILWHWCATIICLPLFIIFFNLPTELVAWKYVAASTFFWACGALVGFVAIKHCELSTQAILWKFKVVYVLILSVLLLGESISVAKIIGTLLVLVAALIVTVKRNNKDIHLLHKGVLLSLLAPLITSCALIMDKGASTYFQPEVYAFIVFFLPGVLITPLALTRKKHFIKLAKGNLKKVFVSSLATCTAYYLVLNAYQHIEANVAIPLGNLGSLFAMVGAIIFLKEREAVVRKFIALGVAIVGAMIVAGVI